jgi:hypothetical protein
MNSSPDDFRDLRRLLALKRHEEPPPGFFRYMPDRIAMRIEREECSDLSEHSTWWEWLVKKLDARPVLAGAYAFAISGLMLLGFKLSQDVQADTGTGWLATTIDPYTMQPGPTLQNAFGNPAELLYLNDLSSTEAVVSEPVSSISYRTFPVKFTTTAH